MTDEASLQLQSIPGPLPVGGEKRRRWGTEGCVCVCMGGGEFGVRGRNEWEGRNITERSHHNKTFAVFRHSRRACLQFSPHGCWLSCCTTNCCCCCCCCCVKIVWRKQRRLSAWEKMDGLIRTWCRHRTSLIILILLHVAAAQSGKVSS